MKKIFTPLLILLVLLTYWTNGFGSFYTVKPKEQIIITQFGRPIGSPISEPGLYLKSPLQNLTSIPKTILAWDGETFEMTTRDKLFIVVNSYARWRVTNALKFYTSMRDLRSADSRLDDIIGGAIRNVIASNNLTEIIRTDKNRKSIQDEEWIKVMREGNMADIAPISFGRRNIESTILQEARPMLAEFGIELIDVRFKRINYNQNVTNKIYRRMISERNQIANKYISEGEGIAAQIAGNMDREYNSIRSEAYRKQQEIRGAADAKASEIYSTSYNTPEATDLYELTKSLEIYKNSITPNTTLILSTQNGPYKKLK